MSRRAAALLTLIAVAAVPVAAVAQEPVPVAPPAAAPVAPVEGKLALTAERVGTTGAVLAGRRFRVRGVLTPAVAGPKVTVRFLAGNETLRTREVTLQPSSTGRSAYFVLGFTTKRTGRITITASHAATAELATVRAQPAHVDVLPLRVRAGSRGRVVRVLQQQLRKLGYVVGRRGSYDARTARAVLAFRKSTGMRRTSVADAAVFRSLAAGAGRFPVRFASHGRHVEADLSKQLVALIGAGGKVERIYPTSSGAPSTPTILGSFKFYSKTPGTNAKGMVYSSYFIRGYAIHGYATVPVYNASHGCLRVPVPDAISIFDWVRIGTPVDVYR
jgi:peptidoglycan hydrolase-like protein with peptidoglycan-binding domain